MKKTTVLIAAIFSVFTLYNPVSLRANPAGNPPEAAGDYTCNLPAPGNFQVAALSPGTALLQWDAVSGAGGYLVTVEETGGPVVFQDQTPNLAMEVTGLGDTKHYTAHVSAVCSVGLGVSPNVNTVEIIVLIVELVVQAQDPGLPLVNVTPCTPLPWTETGYRYWIKVVENSTNNFARFPMEPAESSSNCSEVPIAQLKNATPLSTLSLVLTDQNNKPAPSCTGGLLYIQDADFQKLFAIEVSYSAGNSPTISICGTPFQASQGYQLFLEVIDPGQNGGQGRDAENHDGVHAIPADNGFFIANPIAELLQITSKAPFTSPLRLRLLSPDGRLMTERRIEAGPQQFSLPIDGIPAGLYLLQMEYEGKVTTYRVIKV